MCSGEEPANRPVMAMNRDSLGLDTLRRIDTVGNDLMALRGAGREGNVILEVAGFGITLGRARNRSTPMW